MTKHVEIWTLSKESRVVPYMTSNLEFWEYYPQPDMYVMDGVFTDKAERRFMNVIRVTKCERLYNSLGGSVPNTTDKYIAIHPDVEEAISVKWQEKIDDLIRTHKEESFELTIKLINNEYRLSTFKRSRWYKRVWRSLWNSI